VDIQGQPFAISAATEEWNAGVPVGAWSTGGTLNTARYGICFWLAGTQTAALGFGGFNGSSQQQLQNLMMELLGLK
jgi:hypothetical protein